MEYVIVGDEKGVVIPELRDYPLGKRVMRGLRLIHTHLKNEPVSEDDLTDLSLLRFDLLAALLFTPGKSQIYAQLAWLSPDQRGTSTTLDPIVPLERVDLDCIHFIPELEADLEKAARTATKAKDALERAILISVTTSGTRQEAEDSMAELRELSRTAQVEALDEFIQRPKKLNPRFLMGEGMMRDVVIRAMQRGASMLIFDQELTPAQMRSISAMTELKVIDRSQLILDIFARRAKTLDGKVQVELAQLKYLLPRLTGRGVQMSRLMGGIGGRGPGETKLETDRRRIRDRIASLERELKELSQGRDQRRKQRVKAGVPFLTRLWIRRPQTKPLTAARLRDEHVVHVCALREIEHSERTGQRGHANVRQSTEDASILNCARHQLSRARFPSYSNGDDLCAARQGEIISRARKKTLFFQGSDEGSQRDAYTCKVAMNFRRCQWVIKNIRVGNRVQNST